VRALIRFISRGPGGVIESRDRVFVGEAITLGRATDQVLNLKDRRVDLEHARIVAADSGFIVTSRSSSGVWVNGRVCREAALRPGDVLRIGANTLRFIEPPDAFDLAFTFELDADTDTRAVEPPPLRLSLAELGLSKRPWAWGSFLVVLVVALLLPWLSSPQSSFALPVRGSAIPSDLAWSSGPLHNAHATLSNKCEACHSVPFRRVRDASCLECHAQSLHRHVPLQHVMLPHLASTRCAQCHAEHNSPSTLQSTDERLCVACHANPGTASTLAADSVRVTDFERDHPEFRVTLRVPARDEAAATVDRVRIDKTVRERSGLKFPHSKHLDPEGVNTPSGRLVLGCGDCHVPQPGSAAMQPIRMETHCQRCHELSFDPRDPPRTVPHGPVEGVLTSLVEYYAAAYLAGYPDTMAPAPLERLVRLPGKTLDDSQRERLLQKARDEAARVARDVFERRVCQTCHYIESDSAAGWRVEPVALTTAYMPKAIFSHASHSTGMTGCTRCHDALTSQRSEDLLMPRIETCRACHAGARSADSAAVASTCTLCHRFHVESNPLWNAVEWQLRLSTSR
jgi:predicted CXXCH cytochrome family protein